MRTARPARVRPAAAAALAVAALAAPFLPAAFPLVVVGGALAACALACVRRPSRALWVAVTLVACWLAVGLAGAWAVRERPVEGLLWTLAVLFAVPLPFVPWLYARTFVDGSTATPASQVANPDPASGTADAGQECGR